MRYAEKQDAKKKKKQLQEDRQEFRINHEPKSYWEGLLQKEFNELARIIDKDQPCISCGNQIGKDKGYKGSGSAQGGHLHSVGSNASLRFNLHNIHLQDYRCNVEYSGNEIEYLKGIEDIYGREYMDYLMYGIVKEYPEIKLMKMELIEILPEIRKLKRHYKKLDLVYSIANRIEVRDKINSVIGIYKVPFKQK